MERCRKNLLDCPARLSKTGCRLVLHHLYYPRSKYEQHSALAAEFRDLDVMKVPMCAGEEINHHRAFPEGPPMPTEEVMQYCVDRERERRELAARPIRKP